MSDSPDPRPAPAERGQAPAENERPPAEAEAEAEAAAEADADFEALDESFDHPEWRPDDGSGYGPVPLRYRHDGWVPDRQAEFIEALAECGCVEQAARAVGMSRASAYALRRRPDAQAFRLAWEAALDTAVARLSDAALARAIHGVAVPVFHDGEQVGERRHYDERLTMFLLRYRDPARYGKWLDRVDEHQRQDAPVWILTYRIVRMLRAAWRAFDAAFEGREPPAPEIETVDTTPGHERFH